MDKSTDYLRLYDESNVFNEVGPNFRSIGVIEAADLHMMLIWSSNQAKIC